MHEFGDVAIYAPIIGYGVGVSLENLALKSIAHNRTAAIPGHEAIGNNKNRNFLKTALASLALLSAAAGFSIGQGFDSADTVTELNPPTVSLVVDQSIGTYLDGSEGEIEAAFSTSQNNNYAHYIDIAAIDSGYKMETAKQIINNTPYGQPSVSSAVRGAINIANSHSSNVQSNHIGSISHKKNAGILVFTDGNSIGTPASVVAEDTNKLPVYIVNFGSNANNTQFKTIASETGGASISVNRTTSVDTQIQKFERFIIPKPVKLKNKGDQWPWFGLGIGLSALTVGRYIRRRKETA
jgi:hypothetical protein